MASGTTNVSGALTNNASSTLAIGADTLNVTGNATNSGTITISTGTLDIDGNFTVGTLTASGAAVINIAGNWSGVASFTPNSSTVTFDGSGAQTITGANTWYNLTIANTYATPSDTYDVDPNAAQTVTNLLTVNDGQWTPYSGDDYNNVTINANGIVKPDAGAGLTVSGNWTNNGTFTPNSGTVTFDGSGASVLNGSTTFYNLTSATAGKILSLTRGTTQTVTNALTLTGTAGDPLVLNDTGAGSLPQLNLSGGGVQSITNVNVSENNASGLSLIARGTSSLSNALNWALQSSGATYTWTGSVSTDWNNPANWDLGLVPT